MKKIFVTIAVLVMILLTSGCTKILDAIIENQNKKEEPKPAPVSMFYNDVYFSEEDPDKTFAQFYLRKHSFSFFLKTYFAGAMELRTLVSSTEKFELDKWYSIPTEETETAWESFGMLEHNGPIKESDDKALTGKIRFTSFKQDGKLNQTGEGYCSVEGEFEFTLADVAKPGNISKITEGTFTVPKARYWDSRSMEE